MQIEVGRFSIEDGVVRGPAAYMAQRFDAKVAEILAGRCTVFNYGSAQVGEPGFAADVETAFLVAIQTDFAAWEGSRVFFARAEAGLVPETGLPI